MVHVCLPSLIAICLAVAFVSGWDAYSESVERTNIGENEYAERLKTLEGEIEQLKSQLKEVAAQRYRRQIHIPNEIGFTAVISSHLKSLSASQPIIFDRAVSNIGSSYDIQTGFFIAPVPGTYQFYTTIMSENQNDFIETEIVKNGSQLVELYSGGSSGHDSSGNMVIVSLKKGDHISVRVHGANSNTFSIHCCFSTFSGYLLRIDEDALNQIVG